MTGANQNLVLIGPMGSGKSSVGRCLAAQSDRDFIDSDQELESRCGADIPWIFDIEGEDGFRRRETAVLESLLSRSNMVLATGGGAVLREENRAILKSIGRVVYLTADLDVLFSRVAKDKSRPLLQVENPKKTYTEILEKRDPIYRSLADIVVLSNDALVPSEVAKKIQNRLLEI